MKKIFSLFIALLLLVSFTACGDVLVDLETPKSAELASLYDYYSDSVNEIRVEMEVTPEQADEIFLVLSKCGLESDIGSVSKTGDSYDVRVGFTNFVTTLKDGVVDTVQVGKDTLYPEYIKFNVLTEKELQVDNVNNGFGEKIGEYAYIEVEKSELQEITEANFKEFIDDVVCSEENATFNYIIIKCDDETGLLFSDGTGTIVSYGDLNTAGMIESVKGYISRSADDSYSFEAK